MKKIVVSLFTFLVAVSALLVPFEVALGDGYGLQRTAGAVGYDTSDTSSTIPALVNKIISAALLVLAIVFFGLTLYSGIRWMTARGNEELVTKAKSTLEAAIIGLVIVSLSYALTKFIFSRLGA